MSYEIKGILHLIGIEEAISDTFKKREFVIEVPNEKDSKWNDFIKFQLTQAKCDLLNSLRTGNEITVHFNLKGRQYEKNGTPNYFNSLEAWKIDVIASTESHQQQQSAQMTPIENVPPGDETNDLPF
jgi:hypothetical protein